jgi:hypothetical protein
MLKKIKNFLFKTSRGSLAIGAALCTIPTVVLSIATVQMTSYMGVHTRLHQSQTMAAVNVAKEGDKSDFDEKYTMVNQWMNTNVSPLNRPEDSLYTVFQSNEIEEKVDTVYYPKPLVDKLMNNLFNRPWLDLKPVVAERFYNPLDLVIVFDGSSSTKTYVENYKNMVKNVSSIFMRGRSEADDVRISLMAFSGQMNIGTDYKDKLIIPETLKLYDTGTEAYDLRKQTLQENGLSPENLLQIGGPGTAFKMACIGRKDLAKTATPTEIQTYVDQIENPPSSPAEGFKLLIGDDRPHTEAGTSFTSYGTPYQLVNTFLNNNKDKTLGQYTFLDFMVVPPSLKGPDTKTFDSYKTWGDGWSATSLNHKSSIGIYYNCSSMPMLIGSNSMNEISERVDMYSGGWTTGGDEGLAWALRALSPQWSEVWDKGDNFPAEYKAKTEKIIFYLGDTYNNTGYPNGITGTGPDAISGILEKMVDHDIKLHLFIDGSMWNSSMNKFYTIVSNFIPEEQIHYAGTSAASVLLSLDKMEEIAGQVYNVRLSSL